MADIRVALGSFGILPNACPVDDQGRLLPMHINIQTGNHSYPSEKIYPTELDCLLGRGRPFQNFVGNLRLFEMVGRSRQQYLSAISRKEKSELVEAVMECHKSEGGRFLRRASDGVSWEVAGDAEARIKIGQTFRAEPRRPGPEGGSDSDQS